MLPEKIVVIADCHVMHKNEITATNINLDKTLITQAEELVCSLREIVQEVILYNSINEFINNRDKHRNDLVFPYWYGSGSRNRAIMIPAISCASLGLSNERVNNT